MRTALVTMYYFFPASMLLNLQECFALSSSVYQVCLTLLGASASSSVSVGQSYFCSALYIFYMFFPLHKLV